MENMKFNREFFLKLSIVLMSVSLFIIDGACGGGQQWCPIKWQCGDHSIIFPLPTVIQCDEVKNPCKDGTDTFNLLTSNGNIQINGKEVPCVPVRDSADLSKIRTFMEQYGYNYTNTKNYSIDNNCSGIRAIGNNRMQPDEMWYIRYWKSLESNASKILQITIIIQKISNETLHEDSLREDYAERILKEFHVE